MRNVNNTYIWTHLYKQFYQAERSHWWFIIRNKILLNCVEQTLKEFKIENAKILNVGAATGGTSQMLEKFGEVTSIEYDKGCVDFLRESLKLNAIQGSITALPFEAETFDLVCAFDVIEHVDEDDRAAKELMRVCKKNGVIVLSVPAYQFLWSRHDEVNHHKRRYTKSNFEKLFLKEKLDSKQSEEKKSNPVKLEKLYSSYFNSFLFPLILIFRWLGNIKELIKPSKPDNETLDLTVFNRGVSDGVFKKIFACEIPFLQKKLRFPFGVSILLSLRKV